MSASGQQSQQFRSPIGTRDVLPPESAEWDRLVGTFSSLVSRWGFARLLTPVFEHLEVISRAGESTDVVTKEIYQFTDRGGRELALRPEGTAPVVRAFVEHRPPTPWKVWYFSPNFRYERPQKGRYRQHHQLGVEAIGTSDPWLDIEIIAMAWDFYASVGLDGVALRINSLGDPDDRAAYRTALRAFLAPRLGDLTEESQRRAEVNPLRLFDAKAAGDRGIMTDAPKLKDYLGPAAAAHFEAVQGGLTHLGIPFSLDDTLVRGLDYYMRTTFEFSATTLDAAQNAVGGGGRYDRLTASMGGPDEPGIGFGIGVERLLLALGKEQSDAASIDVFCIDLRKDADPQAVPSALTISAELRRAGLSVEHTYDGRSVKAQWKAADRFNARFAVLIGDREVQAGTVQLKDLHSGEQTEVAIGDVATLVEQGR